MDKPTLYKLLRKHTVPDEDKWDIYQMKKKKSFDDLDKTNAALRLYYQTTELAAAGKRPRSENSDIQSEIEDHQVGRGRRTPKPRDIYSPPSSPSIGGNKRSGITTIRCTKLSYDTFHSPANRFKSSKRVHPPNINVMESVFDSSPLEKKDSGGPEKHHKDLHDEGDLDLSSQYVYPVDITVPPGDVLSLFIKIKFIKRQQ
ncbi:hypothetical protein OUZ56_024122 [Daphnia magna]|uniref:Uncharacterized protein n=1 Tax=Daphnia magna TaxID=35525 RepID=A0ABR0B076_9CRUS|nr:hypothetical protein OUZ56_032299 [Daphnia magna]KAK4030783.1 hypothetical protein OUZ56_024122 [Daphnia magna]